jgi:hypothetical protein
LSWTARDRTSASRITDRTQSRRCCATFAQVARDDDAFARTGLTASMHHMFRVIAPPETSALRSNSASAVTQARRTQDIDRAVRPTGGDDELKST